MPTEEHVCVGCGATFAAQTSNKRKYCSHKCATDHLRKPQTICKVCGKPYTKVYQARTDYCSRACSKADTEARRTRTCQQCGMVFVLQNDSPGKYCSKKCHSDSRKGRKPHNYDPVQKICQTCGKTFEVERCRTNTAKFCSTECSGKAHATNDKRTCVHCGIDFKVWSARKNMARFCSRKCQGMHYRGQNSPSWKSGIRRYYYGPNWKEQRDACRQRDHHTCRHCGRKHKRGERMFDVHHIKPFRTFGYKRGENENYKQANDLTNLVTLCLPCHVKAEHGNAAFQLPLL